MPQMGEGEWRLGLNRGTSVLTLSFVYPDKSKIQAYLTAKGEFLWYPLKDKVRHRRPPHAGCPRSRVTRRPHCGSPGARLARAAGASRRGKRALDQDAAGGQCLPAMSRCVRTDAG